MFWFWWQRPVGTWPLETQILTAFFAGLGVWIVVGAGLYFVLKRSRPESQAVRFAGRFAVGVAAPSAIALLVWLVSHGHH